MKKREGERWSPRLEYLYSSLACLGPARPAPARSGLDLSRALTLFKQNPARRTRSADSQPETIELVCAVPVPRTRPGLELGWREQCRPGIASVVPPSSSRRPTTTGGAAGGGGWRDEQVRRPPCCFVPRAQRWWSLKASWRRDPAQRPSWAASGHRRGQACVSSSSTAPLAPASPVWNAVREQGPSRKCVC